MVTRFDHFVIAVRDLDTAIRLYQRLGFEVQPGGRHTGRGTHNALIRFGLDYIELLSVYDAVEAQLTGIRGTSIIDALQKREGALLGYALATENIEQEAERFKDTELFQPAFAMKRLRPDGKELTWRLFTPGAVAWRRPWPFIIQWDTPDTERLLIEQPGRHLNGANKWVRIAVATRDVAGLIPLYRDKLGLQQQEPSEPAGQRAIFQLGSSSIELFTPQEAGAAQQTLQELGEGPFEVTIAVEDLRQTRSFLAQRDISFEWHANKPDTLILASPDTLGVRFSLVQQSEE
ncbi:hypothetical protein EPA93_34460 [Ktedonosporobacter rubrisoli]|uniref:Glyoxalase-like domain-containing protein n=1 Tax=Ktedonosporobacter rubrisoli TaxID=2509675 RepID=A0A4P6JYC3_KTERU|nr:VOC family protein [Ktedonosporobacter rubrisoli]QBD80799.1 hypothetical protein EPA93_34460 [Ktedonosporobacter rubrisoli]